MQHTHEQELENVIQLPNYGDRRDLVGFKEIFAPDNGYAFCSDDEKTFLYIAENFNKERLKWVEDFCKAHTWEQSCGCSGDCCGCNYKEKADYALTNRTHDNRYTLTITVKRYFNY